MYLYYFLERGTRSKMSTDIKKSKITTWKPKQDDIIVTSDGKIFLIYFEKIFSPEKIKIYDRFFIKKNSYEKQLEVITKYINFFMKFSPYLGIN